MESVTEMQRFEIPGAQESLHDHERGGGCKFRSADPVLCRERCGRAQELDGLLHKGNTCNDVFADSAYRSTEIEAQLRTSIDGPIASTIDFQHWWPISSGAN